MADSIRTDIIQALITRLELILVAGGYETNMGQNIKEWREPNLEESDLPGMVVKDVLDEVEEGITEVGSFLHTLTFECEIVAIESSVIPDIARKCLADFDKAIAVDETFGELAEMTNPISVNTSVEQDKKIVSRSELSFAIKYRTGRWDAYT